MPDDYKTKKVPLPMRVSVDCKATVKELSERLGISGVAVVEEAVKVLKEVLDRGIDDVAARRWGKEEEPNP